MDHLPLDKIMRFISLREIDSESIMLVTEVNKHISECAKCRDKIRSIQSTIDRLLGYSTNGTDDTDVEIIIDEQLDADISEFFKDLE